MDAHNGRVMIRCHACGETCEKWEGDQMIDPATDELVPVCPGCHRKMTAPDWHEMVRHWDAAGGWGA